jgi:serine protease
VTWAANVQVSNSFNPFEGYPNQNKIGDYITVVSDNTGGDVAYSATFNFNPSRGQHEEDVYYVRVSPSGGGTPTPTQIMLMASGSKVRGRQIVDLTWNGATSSNVDIFRNGTRIVTVPNSGAYTDSPGGRGHATYTYQVCNAGTQTCSNQATVTF